MIGSHAPAPGYSLGDGHPPSRPRSASTDLPPDPGQAAHPLRVLLVDDEDMIRRLARGMAKRLQVELLTAASAAEALAVAQATPLDVLVTDVLLGEEQDGIDVARQIVAAQPGLAVVLMSGHTADTLELDGLPPETQFLSKPFGTHALAACLARARGRGHEPRHH